MSDLEGAFQPDSKVYLVYLVLSDQEWHCRECEYAHVQTSQIAGGSGIQGLQRGTQSRDGMVILSEDRLCSDCDKTTRHDRWTGEVKPAIPSTSLPRGFAKRVQQVLELRDIVEMTSRPPSQLTIDHKLPMIRWNEHTRVGQTNYSEMTDEDIRAKFQMLKSSNGSVSHNLLKSRSCETCFDTGQRGTPFGIAFFYEGNRTWAPADKDDPSGCVGCGWYDFAVWRDDLNACIELFREI
ncbi:MAG: restriction endonuclease [Acidimicrobiia bacterium]|nr:restriction endonuclease [Acidimicrobiia bacterium]MYC58081.1 restriction endonuclease [Acidimicrobiia bacterium]MYG93820.1 restriction endonuclease [Acidimicrobiia bacterium]MYI30746.1 restriction endonuclease [Acidimicrobiia bacterium]